MELSSIFGISIAFGLAMLFTIYTFRTLNSFLIWLMIFISFTVWAGILPLWVLIFNMLILIIVIFLKYRSNRIGGFH